MREDIKSLRICGNMFNKATELPLFGGTLPENKKSSCSLVFGRNGAGKSTIAKAFRRLSDQEDNGIVSSELCDNNGTVINLSEDEKKKIYVFDQKFVEDNIKLVGDGLETIVMLGNQVELDKQIQAAEEKQREINEQLNSIKESLDNLNDVNNEGSPLFYEKKMEDALKGDGNWAGRDRLIRGKDARKNTPVSKTSYQDFVKGNPIFTRDELLIMFNDGIKELDKVRKGDKRITQEIAVVELKVNDSYIRKLLLKRIERPKITSRDRLLLDILQQRGIAFVRNIDETFHNATVTNCPYCLQPISDSYKKDLLLSVENVLNEEVKRYQQLLNNCMMEEVKRDFAPFLPLGDITEKCIDLLNKVNHRIESYNNALKKKMENPYALLLVRESNLQQLINDLNQSIKELEDTRRKYNNTVSDEEPLTSKLSSINAGIAYYDLYPVYEKYIKARITNELVEQKYTEVLVKCKYYKNRIDTLNAKKKNVHIAEDIINDSLSYIFYSKDRLRINYVNGCYKILVNGQPVLPSNISTGEANAIALCYFFSTIGAEKTLEDIYKGNYLIVIDDPITSFDNENKIGMLSYIKSQLIQFVRGNIDTKVLIMTHDMMIFMNIFHIYEEIASSIKSMYAASNGLQLKNYFWMLCDGTLSEYKEKEANEYTRLFRGVYRFINSPSAFDGMPIGNMMRQLLEAFSTFQYKLGIADLSTRENILKLIPDDCKKTIENFMYRLVLNNGSHREEEVKFNISMNFNTMYTLDEKIRTAKLLIIFLYILNAEHVLAHLQSPGNTLANAKIEMDLEEWKEEVKNNSI